MSKLEMPQMPTISAMDIDVDIPDNLLSDREFLEGLTGVFQQVVDEAVNFWKTAAGQRLKSTKDRYMQAVNGEVIPGTGGSPEIVMSLKGDALVTAIEYGAPGFDMKPGFLKSKAFTKVPVGGGDIRSLSPNTDAGKFLHPGWPGLNIHEEVVDEIKNNLIPKYVMELMEKVF